MEYPSDFMNQIIWGDCLDVMKNLPNNSIDMVLADLPYGKTKNSWDIPVCMDDLWNEIKRIIKHNGAIIFTSDQPFSADLIQSNRSWFRYSLIWEKTNPTGFLNANRMPLRIHEDILVFYEHLPTYNPIKTYGHERKVSSAYHKRNSIKTTNYGKHKLGSYDSTERYPTSILKFKSDKQKSALHPTQKPVALFEYLIKTYTNENEIVLDPVIGSGTTAISCLNTNRKFIGIEKDEKYWKISQERIGLNHGPN